MGIEIERKFRVIGGDWMRDAAPGRRLRQAYLGASERLAVRVRIEGAERALLTIKTAQPGRVRGEYEYAIPVGDAEELMAHCEGAPIEKVRHDVPVGDWVWQVDVFEGDNAGLVLAELELASPDARFERPDWVGAEVTDDRQFYNAELAMRPFRRWTE